MTRPLRLLSNSLRRAAAALDTRSDGVSRALWRRLGRHPPRHEGGFVQAEAFDPSLLPRTASSLQDMLREVDTLARALPADASAMGEAARTLVQHSIDECRKPLVDARRLARDLHDVGVLALAMRQRILLAPRPRIARGPN